MKQEELLKTLITELMKMDTVHHEYTDNNTAYVIDSQKNGNELTIKVSIKENKDKQEFEKWLENINDEFFSEIMDEIHAEDNLFNLESIYNSKDYKKVINKVKTKAKELASKKIEELQKILN